MLYSTFLLVIYFAHGSVYMGFPGGSVVKNLPANAGDIRNTSLIPELRRSSEGGHGNPLQYSCLENSRDRGAWQATGSPGGSQRIGHYWSDLAHMHVVYTYQYYSLNSSHPLLPLLCKPLTPACVWLFLIKLGPFSNHLSLNFKEHFWTSNIYLHFQHLSLHIP